MDETRLKPIHPYHIILFAQSRKEVGRHISTYESCHLGSLGIFLLRKFPTFGSCRLGFPKVFLSYDVNVFSCLLVYSFQIFLPSHSFVSLPIISSRVTPLFSWQQAFSLQLFIYIIIVSFFLLVLKTPNATFHN
jgi:hypothetical protein